MTPLHGIGDLLRNLFLAIPLEAARVLFLAQPVILLAWLFFIPRGQARPAGAWTDVRLWAAAALVLQILLYVFL
jgi:hypothetical protein